jgi:membrane protein implicated in regulation of membrane protease activity
MLLLIGALLALFLAPSPWNVLGFVLGLVLWIGELLLWHRTVRNRRVRVGAQTLIGRHAEVVTPCHPEGQVRLRGESEIWRARCSAGAESGSNVQVVDVDGITLIVEPAAGGGVSRDSHSPAR